MSRFLRALGIDLSGRDSDERYASAWAHAAVAADASLHSSIAGRDVTDRLSGWGHNYHCPIHSAPLEFSESSAHVHRCVVGDHRLEGEQYDSGWATVRNDRLLQHLEASALAFAVTGTGQHADRAVSILTDLADVYQDLPLHGDKVGQGRLTAQSLEEAMAATSLARSYELIEHRMTPSQRQAIQSGLFRPMVDVIESHMMNRPHNIEVWHLAGLASLAVPLGDEQLSSSTLQRAHGMPVQLTEGLRTDGWWFEGSPGYHFYVITALLAAAESYQALGVDDATTQALERMLVTPVQAARNDLTTPAFNDSSLVTATAPGLVAHADLYFRGERLCRSPELSAFMSSWLTRGFDRASTTYLIYGDTAPDSQQTLAGQSQSGWPVTRTTVFPDSGYAALRQPGAAAGHEPDTCIFLKFGPHGGGHGHPDKLEIDLMVDGERVIADPGAAVYTNPLHRPWYGQTWSHSTVVIDRVSQPPIRGGLLGHRPVTIDDFGYIDAAVEFAPAPDPEGVDVLWNVDDPARVAAYAGVKMRRVTVMTPPALGNYLLDVVVVDSPSTRTIDLITHVRGDWVDAPTGRQVPERLLLPGFSDVRLQPTPSGSTHYRLMDTGRAWARWHSGAQELLTATTPSHPSHERCATTVERTVGSRAMFVAALPLGDTEPSALRTSGSVIEVDVHDVTHGWELTHPVRDGGTATPPVTCTRRRAG